MTRLPIIVAAAIFSLLLCVSASAQPENSQIIIQSLDTNNPAGVWYEGRTHISHGTNGVLIIYGGTILTADAVSLDHNSDVATADGHVHIQQGDQVFVGEHVQYNFNTHDMVADQFRSGKSPVFMEGRGLHGNVVSNKMEQGTYNATNGLITTDDIQKPAFSIRARRMEIIPNQKLRAWDAVLYAGPVPVFYFPYYERNLGPHANNFDVVPGYKSAFGPFALGSYTWWLDDELNGKFHLDYRQRRGVGVGPDFNYNLGRWGDGYLNYY
jgi:lipopolysaccharide assembly outer membrane protein LptD (OstA)